MRLQIVQRTFPELSCARSVLFSPRKDLTPIIPTADSCPARIPRASLHAANRAAADPRSDRATAPPPSPPPRGSRHAAVPRRLQVVGSALLLNVLDPLLGVEDACREQPPIHPPRGQQLKQLARAQSGATGGVMVTMDRGEEQVHGAPGEKANNVELTAKPWQAVGSFALSPCGNSCGRG